MTSGPNLNNLPTGPWDGLLSKQPMRCHISEAAQALFDNNKPMAPPEHHFVSPSNRIPEERRPTVYQQLKELLETGQGEAVTLTEVQLTGSQHPEHPVVKYKLERSGGDVRNVTAVAVKYAGAAPLQPDTLVAILVGTYRTHQEQQQLEEGHSAACIHMSCELTCTREWHGGPVIVDCAEHGNVVRHINDPRGYSSGANLYTCEVQDATSGIVYLCLLTKVEVAPGVELTLDYGEGYWEAMEAQEDSKRMEAQKWQLLEVETRAAVATIGAMHQKLLEKDQAVTTLTGRVKELEAQKQHLQRPLVQLGDLILGITQHVAHSRRGNDDLHTRLGLVLSKYEEVKSMLGIPSNCQAHDSPPTSTQQLANGPKRHRDAPSQAPPQAAKKLRTDFTGFAPLSNGGRHPSEPNGHHSHSHRPSTEPDDDASPSPRKPVTAKRGRPALIRKPSEDDEEDTSSESHGRHGPSSQDRKLRLRRQLVQNHCRRPGRRAAPLGRPQVGPVVPRGRGRPPKIARPRPPSSGSPDADKAAEHRTLGRLMPSAVQQRPEQARPAISNPPIHGSHANQQHKLSISLEPGSSPQDQVPCHGHNGSMWSTEDIRTLLTCVETHGTRWAHIQQLQCFQQNFTRIQLKDKWRSMVSAALDGRRFCGQLMPETMQAKIRALHGRNS